MRIGIIGAMHEEIMELKNSMTDINEIQISNLKFYEGKLCSKDIVLVESGIGNQTDKNLYTKISASRL